MAFIREISVSKLFGLYNHEVDLRADPPVTLMAGPNGIGKTTLLKLTHALLSAAYHEIPKQQFAQLEIASEKGTLTAIPDSNDSPDGEASYRLLLRFKPPGLRLLEAVLDLDSISHRRRPLPSSIEQLGPDVFRDRRTNRYFDREEIERRYLSGSALRRRTQQPESPEWFTPADWKTNLIETKRLDSLLMTGREREHTLGRERQSDRAPIHYYLEAVNSAMRTARLESARIAQVGDRSFARRMLEKGGRQTVNEARLLQRYSQVEEKATELARNGLLVESLDMVTHRRMNPTEKRVMRLFLDDFEAKMRPLGPISARINQLRDIVTTKFLNKHMEIDIEHGPVFFAEPDKALIDPEALSSGEQHELALMSRLLFDVDRGTTVMIDEPELSLHVTWQHHVLDDLAAIAELVGLRFLLATHSTAIINGRWDLVEELGPIDDELSDRELVGA